MQVTCKQCGSEIPVENLNLDRMIAKCTECNAVFNFEDQMEDTDREQPAEKPEVSMPKGFQVENRGQELIITRRWFGLMFIFLAFFCVIWDGFMVFWFGMAFSEGSLMMAGFGTLHAAVGIGLTYYVLAGFFNKTVITVGGRNFTVKHRPLPFPGKELDPNDIEQLYCKEIVNRRSSSSGGSSTYFTYELHALTRDGKHQKVLKGLTEVEQILYVEQEIERFLGIKDRSVEVRGEVDR